MCEPTVSVFQLKHSTKKTQISYTSQLFGTCLGRELIFHARFQSEFTLNSHWTVGIVLLPCYIRTLLYHERNTNAQKKQVRSKSSKNCYRGIAIRGFAFTLKQNQ